MSQFDFGNLSSPLSGTSFIDSNLEPWRDAVHSTHMGDSRPSYAIDGMVWIDNTNASLWGIYVFDGSEDIKLGDVDTANNVFKPAGTSIYAGTAAGTANALTLSPIPTYTALAAGDVFECLIGTTNTAAAPTLAISALDPETIKVNIGSGKVNAPRGCLVAGTPARFLFDGTDFILMNPRPYNVASDIATAATVNLNAALGDYVTLTGTTTITAITLAEGQERTVKAAAAFTLTNGASLILPGGANIDTAAGDVFIVRGEASGVVRVTNYMKSNGSPVSGTGSSVIHLREEKATGLDGGSATTSTWTARILNTVVTNEISGASLSSNTVTLPAGKYQIWARAGFYNTQGVSIRLYNVDDAIEILGSSTYTNASNQVESFVVGDFEILAEKDFQLQYYANATGGAFGLGVAADRGTTEVYAELFIKKVG